MKDNKSGSKKGKTTKRIEKQENIELAQRAEVDLNPASLGSDIIFL